MTLSEHNLIGQLFGKYKLLHLVSLEKENKAAVYKGVQDGLDRAVAIKVLSPEKAEDELVLARFKREQQATANLNHANIITVYDSGVHEGNHYFVTEFLQHQSLADRISEQGQLSIDYTLKLANDVLQALVYTHEKSVLHRNLNANSVCFDLRGSAIIVDFDTIKVLEADTLTQSGELVGSPIYMAPEQINGEKADERSDLYLVAALMYEALAGQRAFPGPPPKVRDEHKVPDLLAFNPEAPQELVEFINKGLAFEREERFQSAAEMLQQLEKLERRRNGRRAASRPVTTVPMEETRPLPAVKEEPQSQNIPLFPIGLIVLLFLAVFISLQPQGKVSLVEQSNSIGTNELQLSCRTNRACYAYVEYYASLDKLKRSEVLGKKAIHNFSLKGLESGTEYYYRFYFSHFPINKKSSSTGLFFSPEFSLHTLDEIKINLLSCAPMVRGALVTWTTNVDCLCLLRYGPTKECLFELESEEQNSSCDHQMTITGLEKGTKYFYLIEARQTKNSSLKERTPVSTFTTLFKEPKPQPDPSGVRSIVGSYVTKFQRMTEDERETLKKSVSDYLLLNPDKVLSQEKKRQLTSSPTNLENFHQRLSLFAHWREQLSAGGVELPFNENTMGKLQALQQVNANKACKKLDLHFKVLYQADRLIHGM